MFSVEEIQTCRLQRNVSAFLPYLYHDHKLLNGYDMMNMQSWDSNGKNSYKAQPFY